MSDMFSKKADKAIGEAIDKASKEFCRNVNLDNFGTWDQKSQNDCRQFFRNAIANKRQKISADQEAIYLIAYSATHGWLHGYACAQEEAFEIISSQDDEMSNQADGIEKSGHEQSNAQRNPTEEAAKSKSDPDGKTDEPEVLESTDDGQLHQKLRRAKGCCWGLALAVVVAIIIILSDWPI